MKQLVWCVFPLFFNRDFADVTKCSHPEPGRADPCSFVSKELELLGQSFRGHFGSRSSVQALAVCIILRGMFELVESVVRCIFLLAASAALFKFAFGKLLTEKEAHRDSTENTRIVYIFKNTPLFHIEGCHHLKGKHDKVSVYKMCDDCFKNFKKQQ